MKQNENIQNQFTHIKELAEIGQRLPTRSNMKRIKYLAMLALGESRA